MRRKTKIILIILGILVVLCALGAIALLKSSTPNAEPRRINLPEGTSFEALCDSLDASATFRFMANILGLDERVRPGSYIVDPHMNELSLVRKLRNGQQDPIRLTIGKFRTPQQLNEYLNSKLMHNDFNVPLDSFYLILQDTYEFFWTVTPQQFMHRMEKEFNDYCHRQADHPRFTIEEMIILASIVEEETNNNAEKPLIASVYLNRLERGMPLQADPTVKYAVGDFTLKRILNKHLAVESPFNT